MTSHHTPGPWKVEEYHGLPVVEMKHERAWIAFLPSVSSFGYDAAEEVRLNARLMAAAPEMLEALLAIADFKPTEGRGNPHTQIAVFAKEAARAAMGV